MTIASLLAFCAVSSVSYAQYVYQTTIPWAPYKQATNVDQSAVYNNTYYLSDRTNAGVNVVNLFNSSEGTLIGGFIEADIDGKFSSHVSGPNGLIVVAPHNEIWAGNGLGHIEVISTVNNSIVATIQTGGAYRADEGAYDQALDIVAHCHPDEDIPYIAIISAANRTVLGNITFPTADGGLEQTAYNAAQGVFYQSVPSLPEAPGGAICVLDVFNLSVTATYPLFNCSPAGIVFNADSTELMVGCDGTFQTSNNYTASYIMDVSPSSPGSILATIPDLTGIDQVAYNSFTNLYYLSASAYLLDDGTSAGFLGIVDAGSRQLVQSIPTDNSTAHSVATDPMTGELLVPVMEVGIVAYKYVGNASMGAGTASGGNATKTGTAPVAVYTGGASKGRWSVGTLQALAAGVLVSMVFVCL